MKLQFQPGRMDCLPTAFAIVMDIPVAEILDFLDHHGEHIVWPQYDYPKNFRGYHPQELVDFALKRGFTVTEIEPDPMIAPSTGDNSLAIHAFSETRSKVRFARYIYNYSGVAVVESILGHLHAVACDTVTIFDPNGTIRPIDQQFVDSVLLFFILDRRKGI